MYRSSVWEPLLKGQRWWRTGVPTRINATLRDRSKGRVLGFGGAPRTRIVSMDILVDRLNWGRLKVVVCQWCLGSETRVYVFIVIAVSHGRRLLRNWRRVPSW